MPHLALVGQWVDPLAIVSDVVLVWPRAAACHCNAAFGVGALWAPDLWFDLPVNALCSGELGADGSPSRNCIPSCIICAQIAHESRRSHILHVYLQVIPLLTRS